jgi:hypothetical protein
MQVINMLFRQTEQILATQLKAPCDDLGRGEPTKPDAASDGYSTMDFTNPADEADSVFGEVLATADELRRKKLQEFLAVAEAERKLPQKTATKDQDDKLPVLRKELEVIVDAEFGASKRERTLIARQKAALLQEITWLESEEQIQRSPKSTKGSSRGLFSSLILNTTLQTNKLRLVDLTNDLRQLPPPITAREAALIRKVERKREKEACQNMQPEVCHAVFSCDDPTSLIINRHQREHSLPPRESPKNAKQKKWSSTTIWTAKINSF